MIGERQWLAVMRSKVSDERQRERNHLAKMSEQFNCLRYRCGVRYGLIPRKTHMKAKLPVDDINAMYELLLTNIENGKVKAVERPLISKLLETATAFRNGKLLSGQKTYLDDMKVKFEKEFEEVKQEYKQDLAGTHAHTRTLNLMCM